MSLFIDNALPVTDRDAARLEAAMRRAINSPHLGQVERSIMSRRAAEELSLVRLALIAKAQTPHLLNLVGSGVIGAVVWPHPMPLLGVGCFVLSSLISMRRAAR